MNDASNENNAMNDASNELDAIDDASNEGDAMGDAMDLDVNVDAAEQGSSNWETGLVFWPK